MRATEALAVYDRAVKRLGVSKTLERLFLTEAAVRRWRLNPDRPVRAATAAHVAKLAKELR